MSGKLTHILTGVHTAGKTTLGQLLGQKGFLFFHEIAVDAIEGMQPWRLGAEFDERVISRELERDTDLRQLSQPFFVETWHVGNFAYARTRNPSVANKHALQIGTRVREFNPQVYFLDLSPELLRARTQYFTSDSDRSKAVSFYFQVRAEFYRVFEILQLNPIIIDASETLDRILDTVMANEKSHCAALR